MQSAKEHVGNFLHGSGKHTADLHSHQNAPVTHETVKPTQEENVTRAVDREVHEEHHQTEVQPVLDREVKSTEHHHNVLPAETRHQHHGHESQVKDKLGSIAGAFSNKQHVEGTSHVQGDQSELVGEHHHHHIHHTVQPVVKKETIQPHVVHTTQPVHEKVDVEPVVHGATVAKPMSMDQFKSQVGVGGADKHESIDYQGDALNISKDANVGFMHGGHSVDPSRHSNTSTGLTGSARSGGITGDHHHSHHGGAGTTSTGATAAAMTASQPHNNRDATGAEAGLRGVGRGNDYQPSSTDVGHTGVGGAGHHNHPGQIGQNIGTAATTLGDRDNHHQYNDRNDHSLLGHNRTHDTTTHGHGHGHGHQTTDTSNKMPGEFVHDSGHTGISNLPGTTGHNTHTATGKAANPTGFIDGRSPNDNKTTTDDHGKEKSGGLISGIINKMKS